MKPGWEVKRLGEVAAIDKRQHKAMPKPFVGLEHIESQSGRYIGDLQPAEVESNTFAFTQKHVLYGRLRPYLNKVLLPDFEGHCSTEIFPIRPSSALDRAFLAYWLRMPSTVAKIDATSTGARMPRANVETVLTFNLPLPPLAEQRRIVAVLDEAFAALATATANTQKTLANARELFDIGVDRAIGLDGAAATQRLSEVCDLISGQHIDAADYNTCGAGMGYLTGPSDFGEIHPIVSKWTKVPKRTARANDVLITVKGSGVGKVNLLTDSEVCISRQLMAVRAKRANAMYLFALLRRYADRFQSLANGAAIPGISREDVLATQLPMHDWKTQDGIAERIQEIRDQVDGVRAMQARKLALLAELKQSLLARAFAGELT